MKLLNPKAEIKTEKSFPGLLNCVFKYEIKSASATLDYQGPQMDPVIWKQVLAFFQWTYDTTHSESQVRLFVNLKEPKWAAWAFPQEARTGMTAKELDTDDMKLQRAQFGDADGWVYFGTVHHHCSASAFQSGTDEDNEKGIDGLHITIGSMNGPHYDMHARFYLGGCKFEPDLSKFWDIGANLKELCPVSLWDQIARFQMTRKVSADTVYPAQWRTNLIEVKATFPTGATDYRDYRYSNASYPWTPSASSAAQTGYLGGTNSNGGSPPLSRWIRARRALGELAMDMLAHPYSIKDQQQLSEWIEALHLGQGQNNQEDEVFEQLSKLFTVLGKHDVQLIDLWGEVPHDGRLDGPISSYKTGLGITSHPANPANVTTKAATTGQVLGLVEKNEIPIKQESMLDMEDRGYSGMMD